MPIPTHRLIPLIIRERHFSKQSTDGESYEEALSSTMVDYFQEERTSG